MSTSFSVKAAVVTKSNALHLIHRQLVKQETGSVAHWIKDCLLEVSNGWLLSIFQDSINPRNQPKRVLVHCGSDVEFVVNLDDTGIIVSSSNDGGGSQSSINGGNVHVEQDEMIEVSVTVSLIANNTDDQIIPNGDSNSAESSGILSPTDSLWVFVALAAKARLSLDDLWIIVRSKHV